MEVLVFGLVGFAIAGTLLRAVVANSDSLATAGTVFCGIFVQALPFLGLGVVVSGLIAVFVPPERLVRWLPRRPAAAVLAAGVAGAALPGCECASVPIAGRLCARGVQPAAALAFMLAAPAVNPVVLVATAVAFPGQPQMVLARFCGSLLTSITVGLIAVSKQGFGAADNREMPWAAGDSSGFTWNPVVRKRR